MATIFSSPKILHTFSFSCLLWCFCLFFIPHFPLSAATVTFTPSDGDTYVAQDSPDQNYGSEITATVRSWKGKNLRALYYFDLSSIPPYQTIDSATLYLNLTIGDYSIDIHRVTSSWSESSVTWNIPPTYSVTATASGTDSWDVTADVEYFCANPNQNFGWLLRFSVEDNSPSETNQYSTRDASSGFPRLEISYTPPASDPPALDWSGEPGFESDGLEPEAGDPNAVFTYRVVYSDPDNDAPGVGYPKVHILDNDSEFSESPYTMAEVNSDDLTYIDGKMYTYTITMTSGSDYSYYFEAQDIYGGQASGGPADPNLAICAPLVTSTGLSLYVDPNGSDTTGDGMESNPYQTIGKGLTVAVSGQTVLVKPGIYSENIVMKQGVGVVGESGADLTALIGDGNHAVVSFSGQLTNCTLSGFEISGGNTDGGIFFEASGFGITLSSIFNCVIHANEGPGIKLSGPVSIDIIGNEAYQNGCAGIGSLVSSDFTQWDDTVGALIEAPGGQELFLNIRDNIIRNNLKAGIALRSADGGAVYRITIGSADPAEGNQIYDNARAGIALGDLGQVTIQNNYLSNNSTTATKYAAGIYLQDVSSDPNFPSRIEDNEICDHQKMAVKIEGASTLVIENNDIYNNWGGIVFPTKGNSSQWSLRPVTIKGNHIYNNIQGSNTKGGIVLGSNDTPGASLEGLITIIQNEIAQNLLAGIAIFVDCTVEITKNNIHNSLTRGGIHTGGGNPYLTIRQNKVHHNPDSSYGGGIDVRHAYNGLIENNLVYRNGRGGIRFGSGIAEIINNTVAYNGNNRRGGGIIYDDLSEDPNGRANGNCDGLVFIRNNISVFNETAGLRMADGQMCPINTDGGDGILYRDYNLVYGNNGAVDYYGVWADCAWSTGPPYIRSCVQKQYGECGLTDFRTVLYNPHDIIADPLFINAFLDNYHLQEGSPGIDAGCDPNTDLGAYGGIDPLVDEEIPGG